MTYKLSDLVPFWEREEAAIRALDEARADLDEQIRLALTQGARPADIARMIRATGRVRIYNIKNSGTRGAKSLNTLPTPTATEKEAGLAFVRRDGDNPHLVHVQLVDYAVNPQYPDKLWTVRGTYNTETFETIEGDELGGIWEFLEPLIDNT